MRDEHKISPTEIRGALGSVNQLFICIGILAALVAGLPLAGNPICCQCWSSTFLVPAVCHINGRFGTFTAVPIHHMIFSCFYRDFLLVMVLEIAGGVMDELASPISPVLEIWRLQEESWMNLQEESLCFCLCHYLMFMLHLLFCSLLISDYCNTIGAAHVYSETRRVHAFNDVMSSNLRLDSNQNSGITMNLDIYDISLTITSADQIRALGKHPGRSKCLATSCDGGSTFQLGASGTKPQSLRLSQKLKIPIGSKRDKTTILASTPDAQIPTGSK
ncbi:hypothetical protein AHAS_Ahas15G0349400 [Arachis hypogaea]